MALTFKQFPKEYYDCLDKLRDVAEESIGVIVKAELDRERADSPIEMKRAKIYKMYPHLQKLCVGDINLLISALGGSIHPRR